SYPLNIAHHVSVQYGDNGYPTPTPSRLRPSGCDHGDGGKWGQLQLADDPGAVLNAWAPSRKSHQTRWVAIGLHSRPLRLAARPRISAYMVAQISRSSSQAI